MPSAKSGISFKSACLRALFYAASIALLMQVLYCEGSLPVEARFQEHGLTEMLQSLLLLTDIALLATLLRPFGPLRHVALLLLVFLMASLIREQDSLFDRYLFDGAWQTLAVLVVAPSLGWLYHRRRHFLAEFARYANSFAFGLFAGGFLCTYVFSRLYGRSSFWETLLGEQYLRLFKRAAEEITELFGYTLILLAVVELTLLARRLARSNVGAIRHHEKAREPRLRASEEGAEPLA